MSQKIVKKDRDYGFYSGADLETALKIAKLQTLIKSGLIKENTAIQFLLMFLDQKRKAFFGTTATELTKLGFILGDPRKSISALK